MKSGCCDASLPDAHAQSRLILLWMINGMAASATKSHAFDAGQYRDRPITSRTNRASAATSG
jgi:hypothetical protein